MTDEQFQLELRRRARSKLAYIHGTKPHPKEEGKILHCHVAGTIVSAEKKFLYVVVLSSIVHHNAVFHVVLPDGSETHLTSKDFSKPVVPGGRLSGFYIKRTAAVNYDVNQISAVEFGGDVSLFQQVYVCDFNVDNFNFTGGQVIDSDEVFFTHTCGPAPNTGHGVPVLDVDSRLVGFSAFNMQGPTKSLPRITFEKELNKIVNSKDLKHFKHLIYMAGWNMVRDVR